MAGIQGITVQKNAPAGMRDGTTLVADIYRPGGDAADSPYPVLLTRQPYGKELPIATDYMDAIQAAGHGYIVVIQDGWAIGVTDGIIRASARMSYPAPA